MNEFIELIADFPKMSPDDVIKYIRAAIDADQEEQRKINNLYAPDVVIEFFKIKNINQTTAFQNGLMLYMYLILWKEQNPLRFNALEEFFLSYVQDHHVVLKKNLSSQ